MTLKRVLKHNRKKRSRHRQEMTGMFGCGADVPLCRFSGLPGPEIADSSGRTFDALKAQTGGLI